MSAGPAIHPRFLIDDYRSCSLYVLVPFGKGARHLRVVHLGEKAHVTLGNNQVTGLSESKHPNARCLNESQAYVSSFGTHFYTLSQAGTDNYLLYVNGQPVYNQQTVLKTGDYFSLLGNIGWFNYVYMSARKYEEMKEVFFGMDNMLIPSNDYVPLSLAEQGKMVSAKRVLDVAYTQVAQESILMNRMTDTLRCGICMDFFVNPTTLSCGCTYCIKCVEMLRATGTTVRQRSTCPLCRLPSLAHSTLVKNVVLANAVEEVIEASADQALKDDYKKRKNARTT